MNQGLKSLIDFLSTEATFSLSSVIEVACNQDYVAHKFYLTNLCCQFRVAKITPKKLGGFVALWKKDTSHKNVPYQYEDFQLCLVFIQEQLNTGVFVFTNQIMYYHKLLSAHDGGIGKLGFRVYPDWVCLDSKAAQKTQSWQTKYFINFANDLGSNIAKLQSILNQEII